MLYVGVLSKFLKKKKFSCSPQYKPLTQNIQAFPCSCQDYCTWQLYCCLTGEKDNTKREKTKRLTDKRQKSQNKKSQDRKIAVDNRKGNKKIKREGEEESDWEKSKNCSWFRSERLWSFRCLHQLTTNPGWACEARCLRWHSYPLMLITAMC